MLGYDPESFWDQTPRTSSLDFDALQEIQINRHNDRAWLAWHVAALHRAKKMPQLNSLMARKPTPAPVDPKQKMQAQIDGLIRWAIQRGDTVINLNEQKHG